MVYLYYRNTSLIMLSSLNQFPNVVLPNNTPLNTMHPKNFKASFVQTKNKYCGFTLLSPAKCKKWETYRQILFHTILNFHLHPLSRIDKTSWKKCSYNSPYVPMLVSHRAENSVDSCMLSSYHKCLAILIRTANAHVCKGMR